LVHFDGRAIRDLAGNAYSDTLAELRFGIYSPDSLGSLRIHLDTDDHGQYLVDLFLAYKHEYVETDVGDAPGEIMFSRLPAGRYVMEVTSDANRNSKCDPGFARPWEFAEPFIIPLDTLTIRARWEQEITVTWPEHR
jgi:hypothetical protein